MFNLKGAYNNATVYTDNVDNETIKPVYNFKAGE